MFTLAYPLYQFTTALKVLYFSDPVRTWIVPCFDLKPTVKLRHLQLSKADNMEIWYLHVVYWTCAFTYTYQIHFLPI